MKEVIGYKVVFLSRRMRVPRSAVLGASESLFSSWVRRYRIGKRTTGHRGSKVFAFRFKKDAQAFAACEALPIYKAKLENPHAAASHLPNPWAYPPQKLFREYWADGHIPLSGGLHTPPGTVVCDAITLLEKVE